MTNNWRVGVADRDETPFAVSDLKDSQQAMAGDVLKREWLWYSRSIDSDRGRQPDDDPPPTARALAA